MFCVLVNTVNIGPSSIYFSAQILSCLEPCKILNESGIGW